MRTRSARRFSRPLPYQLGDASVNWRKGQESNLQATSAVVFGTTALPVRLPFRNLWCMW